MIPQSWFKKPKPEPDKPEPPKKWNLGRHYVAHITPPRNADSWPSFRRASMSDLCGVKMKCIELLESRYFKDCDGNPLVAALLEVNDQDHWSFNGQQHWWGREWVTEEGCHCALNSGCYCGWFQKEMAAKGKKKNPYTKFWEKSRNDT